MLDRLLDFLGGRDSAASPEAPDLDVAVAALLIEAARMDDTFDANERRTIVALLSRHFSMTEGDAETLVETAAAKLDDSPHYFRFTHRITHAMDEEARGEVMEMLWRVAYADGELDASEDALIRQIAGLIGVSDRARMLARQRAIVGD